MLKLLRRLIRPAHGKKAFIAQLPPRARLLDVGCGNHSPEVAKAERSDIYYLGLDIGDYNQSSGSLSMADDYVLTTPEDFDRAILEQKPREIDAVISAHNIEHCSHPERVLRAMCQTLKPGGLMYLAFPSEASAGMPSRKNTLNFHDDPTHQHMPIWQDMLTVLGNSGMEIIFAAQRHRPPFAFIIGLFCEPFVAPRGRQAPFGATWALYGFESVIWARKS